MSLWIWPLIVKYIQSLRICTRLLFRKCKGTSFCTCNKASMTVEAAVVVPIMAGFLCCILFLFRVLQVQEVVEEALIYAGRKAAVESSVLTSEEALFLSAEVHLLQVLEENDIIEQYVKYGILGVNILKSDFSANEIVLCAEYEMMLPVKFFGIDRLSLFSENRFRKWVGTSVEKEIEWVYVTPTGSVYHVDTGCRVIDLSVKAVAVQDIEKQRGADGQRYYPCGRCDAAKETLGIVYCTDYGTLYHGTVSCSALKRSVKKIAKSEVEGLRACSFCCP